MLCHVTDGGALWKLPEEALRMDLSGAGPRSYLHTVPISKFLTYGWATCGQVSLIIEIFECTSPHLVLGERILSGLIFHDGHASHL